MLKKRKGQITIFVIVGIVILAAFMFIFYLTRSYEDTQIENRVTRLASQKLDAAGVKSVASNCLDSVLEDGLELIGLQGGYIYDYAPGGYVTEGKAYNATIDNLNYTVPYWIDRGFDFPPRYPCGAGAWRGPVYCGFINDILFFPQLDQIRYGKLASPDLTSTLFSVQKQLEAYVRHNVAECADFSAFSAFGITTGDIDVNITFGLESVSAVMTFPITVKIEGQVPVIEYNRFTSTKPVKFRQLFEAVKVIFGLDNSNLDFDLVNDGKLGTYAQRTLHSIVALSIDKRADNEPDDLFVFEDASSLLGGRPYRFAVMRENRAPALDLILQHPRPIQPDFEFIIGVGEVLEFRPKAADPDEDEVYYQYLVEPGCQMWAAGADNVFTQSQLWLYGDGSCPPRQCASYVAVQAGECNVTIKATDVREWDSQRVRIRVEPRLVPVVRGYNYYSEPGISPEIASIEDPYVVDASATPLPPSYLTYWYDEYNSNKDQIYPVLGSGTMHNLVCMLIPSTKHCLDFSGLSPMDMSGYFDVTGEHNVSVEIQDLSRGFRTPAEFNTTVYECLPHRGTRFAYPYHNISSPMPSVPIPDFQGNHTCCSDDFEYLSSDTTCFSYTLDETCAPTQPYHLQSDLIFGVTPVEETTNPLVLEPNIFNVQKDQDCEPNDICKLSYVQKCSGNRGNVCSGGIEAKWTLAEDCGQYQQYDETCTGPDAVGFFTVDATNCPFNDQGQEAGVQLHCVNYVGTTFEESFLGTGDGACIKTPRCSPGPDTAPGTYGAGGVYLCNATCDTAGGCTATTQCTDCRELQSTIRSQQCVGDDLVWFAYEWTCDSMIDQCVSTQNIINTGLVAETCLDNFRWYSANGCIPTKDGLGNKIRMDWVPYNGVDLGCSDTNDHPNRDNCNAPPSLPLTAPNQLIYNAYVLDSDNDLWDNNCDTNSQDPCTRDSYHDNCGGPGCPVC